MVIRKVSMSDKFSIRLVSEIDSQGLAQQKTVPKILPISVPNVVSAVKSKALSSLSFQDNFPFISEVAALTPEEMLNYAENPDV